MNFPCKLATPLLDTPKAILVVYLIISQLPSSNTGWWLGHPSEKYEFVSWDDEIPNISGRIIQMATKPPTVNQLWFTGVGKCPNLGICFTSLSSICWRWSIPNIWVMFNWDIYQPLVYQSGVDITHFPHNFPLKRLMMRLRSLVSINCSLDPLRQGVIKKPLTLRHNWCFPYMEVPNSWLVFVRENTIKYH